MPSTPQLILVLSPTTGNLQIEIPGPNGARQVLALEGTPKDQIANLYRLLYAQRTGAEPKLGDPALPTQHEFQHWNHKSPTEGCPFCQLGLQHSSRFCNEGGAKPSAKPKKKSTKPKLDLSAWEPPWNPEDLGL